MSSYVGFANIPNQVHRKTVKRGFEFTLMVAGESGLGKSTLVNSLFLTDLYAGRELLPVKDCIARAVGIETSTVEIEERGVRLRLTVVDTPGFGDSIDCSENFPPIINYVNDQFENYLRDESGLNRRNITDGRIHCCFYFISPSGHGLRPIDVSFLKEIHEKVNIVPVIGKADMLTKTELNKLKSTVMTELKDHGIHIYELPGCDDEEDEEFQSHMKELRVSIPYAVVGSNTLLEINGKMRRCREYPWGTVEVENPKHCDFSMLRTMLTTCMQDLKEVTQDYHYENYRAQKLSKPPHDKDSLPRNAKASTRDNHDGTGDKDKDTMLKEKEIELQRMQEMIAKMQEQMRLQQQK